MVESLYSLPLIGGNGSLPNLAIDTMVQSLITNTSSGIRNYTMPLVIIFTSWFNNSSTGNLYTSENKLSMMGIVPYVVSFNNKVTFANLSSVTTWPYFNHVVNIDPNETITTTVASMLINQAMCFSGSIGAGGHIAGSGSLGNCNPFRPVDVVFILDSSGSLGLDNWNLILEFCASIVSVLPIGPSADQ